MRSDRKFYKRWQLGWQVSKEALFMSSGAMQVNRRGGENKGSEEETRKGGIKAGRNRGDE